MNKAHWNKEPTKALANGILEEGKNLALRMLDRRIQGEEVRRSRHHFDQELIHNGSVEDAQPPRFLNLHISFHLEKVNFIFLVSRVPK